ncbi:MAG: pilus assembly protein PilM [Gammaproteobacteria bacterium]|nr:pilus assembly protein PilM [Gammaproteobacteria bacterium]
MKKFINKALSIIGLDIRLNNIRFIHLRHIKKVHKIEAIEILELPANAIVDGKIKAPEQVAQGLRAIIQRTNTENASACLALPIQCVITKRIKLLKKLSIKQQIEEYMAKHFPGVSHDLCYDYTTLSDLSGEDNLYENILLVAARQEQLNDYVKLVEQAGLRVKTVDVDIYALARAVHFILPKHSFLGVKGVLNIEFNSVLFIILRNDEVIYHSQWDYISSDSTYEKLKHAMQLYHSIYPYALLNCLYVFDFQEKLNAFISKIESTLHIKVKYFYFYQPQIAFSAGISFARIKKNLEEMFICYGLALRGIAK